MKTLILVLFISIPSYAQNFMMYMDVQETTRDTTIYYCEQRVVWGMKEDEICFIWGEDKLVCFMRRKGNIPSKAIRKAMEKYIEALEKLEKVEDMQGNKDMKIRDLFYNRWGEVFLITVYINKGALIIINGLDDKAPHYSFKMILKIENYEQN